MAQLLHQYFAQAESNNAGTVLVGSSSLPTIMTEPPKDFGGSGEHWSPEDLLMGAIADCFVLSFQSIATASNFIWERLICKAQGSLEQVGREIKFTHIVVQAELFLTSESGEKKAKMLLDKAKRTCFVSNSLNAEISLEINISKG